MAFSGETVKSIVGYAPPILECPDCGSDMELEVLMTCAYYIGYFCQECGPYSRESGYYDTEEEAVNALESGDFGR